MADFLQLFRNAFINLSAYICSRVWENKNSMIHVLYQNTHFNCTEGDHPTQCNFALISHNCHLVMLKDPGAM